MFPIRVDADRRPDLAERFGMGGWPSTVFLTPEGDWITGSTYMDPEDFRDTVRRVKIYFEYPERREDLERERGYLEERMVLEARRRPAERLQPSPRLLQQVVDSMQAAIGKGVNPGFEALLMLLEYSDLAGDAEAERAVLGLLDRTAAGSLNDLDSTFFLAPLTPDGALLDREVHLALNAGLLAAFARATRQTGRPTYRAVARRLGEALQEGFYSASDSLFFAGRAGFKEALPSGTGHRFAMDTAFYAGWNALTATAFLELYLALGEDRYLEISRRVLGALGRRLSLRDGAFLHTPDASEDVPLLLEDQALVARAALDLFEIEHRPEDLRLARDLADRMVDQFADRSGALRDRAPEPGRAFTPALDRFLPSGNGVAVQVLVRLHGITDHAGYREAAGSILTALVGPSIDRMAYLGALGRGLILYSQTAIEPAESL